MKTYKRIIALLLAAVAILSLTGCGAKKSEEPAPSAGTDALAENATPAPSPEAANTPEPTWQVSEEPQPTPEIKPVYTAAPKNYPPLSELPESYPMEDAQKDGCVLVNSAILESDAEASFDANYGTWLDFKDKTSRGECEKVRFAWYVFEDIYYLYDLEFDGENYNVTQFFRDKTAGFDFEYLESYRFLRGDELDEEGKPIDGLYTHYGSDISLAEADGCVVMYEPLYDETPQMLISGQEIWDEFYANAKNGTPDVLRAAVIYPDVDEITWVQNSDLYYDYPADGVDYALRVFEVEFDGCEYIYRTYNSDKEVLKTVKYPYLVQMNSDIGNYPNEREYWLMFTDKYTWKAAFDVMASQQASSSRGAAMAEVIFIN